jgi:hypothetical protein
MDGPQADTSQSGRCHAPIKSRQQSSAAAGDTTTVGQTKGRHQAKESARRLTEGLPAGSDATVRPDHFLTEIQAKHRERTERPKRRTSAKQT